MTNIKYPTLFSRTSTGAIQEWYMEQEGDKYRTTSGQQDGKKVTTEWNKALPKNTGKKNATTGEEQAKAEILATYTKKKKQKYKDDVADIDIKTFFNPMCAKKYSEYKDKVNFFDGTWIAQIKYNGMRIIFKKDGAWSRTGERVVSVPHIEKSLAPYFKQYPYMILDGELYNYDLRQKLNELMSLCRQQDPTAEDLVASEQMVRFYVYDSFWFSDSQLYIDPEYILRKVCVDDAVDKYPQYLRRVENLLFFNKEELLQHFNVVVDDGQEGLMLRNIHSVYENKKSKNLLKFKVDDDDDEGKIIAIKDGLGNWQNKCKTFTILWNGITFDATLKGSMEDALDVWEHQEDWINKEVTFLYMGLTGYGVPNFARVDYHNCFKKFKK